MNPQLETRPVLTLEVWEGGQIIWALRTLTWNAIQWWSLDSHLAIAHPPDEQFQYLWN